MERAKVWGPSIGALLVALALAFLWNLSHRARVAAERDAEGYKLRLAGQIVAADDSDKTLRASIEQLLQDNESLRQAYDAARAASPGARPTASASLSTGRVRVGGADSPPAPQPAPAPVGEVTKVEVTPENDLTGKLCVLHDQEEVSIESEILTLATRQNNLLIAGVASLYREPAHQQLATGKFTASLSQVEALAPPPEPRWGAMALGLCAAQGCGLGAAVLLPPARVFGMRIESMAGVALGPVLSAQAGLGVRW